MDEKKITLVIGKRGSGKSVLVKHLIAPARRLVVFDMMIEYKHGVCFGREDLGDMLTFWSTHYRGAFRMNYRPLNPKVEIEWLARGVFLLGDLTFVVEEIDAVCTAWVIPEWLGYCIQRGRHKNIELIGVTPAPFGINRDLTRQAKRIIVFNTNEPKDIAYLKNLLGEAIEAKLAGLEPYEFVEWRDGSNEMVVGKYQASVGQIVYRTGTAPEASDQPGLQDQVGMQVAPEVPPS